jgi:HSP20 family protein
MVMRFDPFREVEGLMEEMQAGRRGPRLLMDAYRRGDEFIVHFDLPAWIRNSWISRPRRTS